MNRLYRVAGILLTLMASGFFLQLLVHNLRSIPATFLSREVWLILGAAALVYSATVFTGGLAWHLLLVGAGGATRLRDSLVIFGLANFAKFLPGNIAQYPGRVALARAYRLPTPRVVLTMVLEAGCLVVAASSLALIPLPIGDLGNLASPRGASVPFQFLVVAATCSALLMAATWALGRWQPAPVKRLLETGETRLPGLRVLAGAFGLYVATFIVVGMILRELAAAMSGPGQDGLWITTGIFALSWVAGFLTPGAPAGLGMREAVLVIGLRPIYGEGAIVAITLGLRLATTVGDGLAFLVCLLARRWIVPPNDLRPMLDDPRSGKMEVMS